MVLLAQLVLLVHKVLLVLMVQLVHKALLVQPVPQEQRTLPI
jgi:hypothetical protein